MQRINLLGEKKANDFYRACLIYITSQKCLTCKPHENTSVGLCLLCTSIETISEDSSKYPFEVWLWKFKLDDLENKGTIELKKAIQSAHKEYLKHPKRTGRSYDFKQFLIEYCPHSLRTSVPIRYSPSIEQKIEYNIVQFEDSVEYIYSRFRSLYMHKGIHKLNIPEKFKKISGIMFMEFYDKKKKYYHTDLEQLPKWFSKVVIESLFSFLMKKEAEARAS